ncbi:hypothetical protein BS78_02G165700 [Paspalum vaginatum]|nr:hypothetical protein BS78_02G165700 [Paspalum vaginatum]
MRIVLGVARASLDSTALQQQETEISACAYGAWEGSRSTDIQACDRMSDAAPSRPVHNWRPTPHTHQSQATGSRRAALRCGGAGSRTMTGPTQA